MATPSGAIKPSYPAQGPMLVSMKPINLHPKLPHLSPASTSQPPLPRVTKTDTSAKPSVSSSKVITSASLKEKLAELIKTKPPGSIVVKGKEITVYKDHFTPGERIEIFNLMSTEPGSELVVEYGAFSLAASPSQSDEKKKA